MTPAVQLLFPPRQVPGSQIPDSPASDSDLPDKQVSKDAVHFGQLSQALSSDGHHALKQLDQEALRKAWNGLLGELSDARSDFWQTYCELEQAADEFVLHPKSLIAALSVSLPELRWPDREHSTADLGPVDSLASPLSADPPPALAVLAGNVPVLLLQVLQKALLAGRPIVFKLPSDCCSLHLAVLRWLSQRVPELARATAALSWAGGSDAVEVALQRSRPGFSPLLVYGGSQTIRRYQSLFQHQRLLCFGPKTSVALVVDDDSTTPDWLQAVARDVALFDQRGCLSVTALVLVQPVSDQAEQDRANQNRPEQEQAEPARVARRAEQLAKALHAVSTELPLARSSPDTTAAARHWIDTAILGGSAVFGDIAQAGTVLVTETLGLSPGARSVALVPAENIEEALDSIARFHGEEELVQGVVLAGLSEAELPAVHTRLEALGVSRTCPAGQLQEAGQGWNNGGIDLEAELRDPS